MDRNADNVETIARKDLVDLVVPEQATVCFLAFQDLTVYRILKFFPDRQAISHLNEISMHLGSFLSRVVGGFISLKFKPNYREPTSSTSTCAGKNWHSILKKRLK